LRSQELADWSTIASKWIAGYKADHQFPKVMSCRRGSWERLVPRPGAAVAVQLYGLNHASKCISRPSYRQPGDRASAIMNCQPTTPERLLSKLPVGGAEILQGRNRPCLSAGLSCHLAHLAHRLPLSNRPRVCR